MILLLFMLLQEPPPPESSHGFETFISDGVYWLKLIVEGAAALIIGIGVFIGLYHSLRALILQQPVHFARNRLRTVALSGLCARTRTRGDILATGIAPTWDEIGKLAAIAVVRTALNYFLSREMREQQDVLDRHAETENAVA
jgi:uncharacterized membrane protein